MIMAFGYTCSLVASNFALSKQAVVCLQVRFVAAPLPAKAPLFVEPEMSERIAKGASGDRARRCPYALRKSKLPDFNQK